MDLRGERDKIFQQLLDVFQQPNDLIYDCQAIFPMSKGDEHYIVFNTLYDSTERVKENLEKYNINLSFIRIIETGELIEELQPGSLADD